MLSDNQITDVPGVAIFSNTNIYADFMINL